MLKTSTLFLLVLAPQLIAGELMVHPTRVVFEGNTRTAQVDVINSGTETATYRISIVRRRMTETGEFVPVVEPSPGEQFSDGMIRFSPRQVVLPPGGAQAVRLQLRIPPDLEDGEYRSHLLFQALPATDSRAAAEPAADSTELDIRLSVIYSVSIPLIVRKGATAAEVAIRDLAVGAGAITFALDRQGTRSVYGDLIVSVRGARGPERVIARANGVAVYTPNGARHVRIPLPAEALPLPPGELRVAFAERPLEHGRVTVESRVALR